jgi:hypothetical protein
MRCRRMSTSNRTPSAPLFVIPPDMALSACAPRFVIPSKPAQAFSAGASRLFIPSLPAAGRLGEGSAFACAPPNPAPGTLPPAHSDVSHSTHGARVLLVFPIKSLKILLSGRTVVRTNPELLKPVFSRNARRPRLAFPRISWRTRLFGKPSRICSSSWRSL